MADPLSTLVLSSFNALKVLVELGLRWKDVTPETRNFLLNIRQVDEKINTARRLRRQKSGFLDTTTKKEVDNDIKNAHLVMQEIGKTIEPNRVDLDLHDSVGTWNRLKWLLRGHSGFMSHQNTLNIALQALICSINRMTAVQRPSMSSMGSEDSLEFQAPLMPPSARRRAPRWSSDGESDRSSIKETLHKIKSQPVTTEEKEVVSAREPFYATFDPYLSSFIPYTTQSQRYNSSTFYVGESSGDVIERFLSELDTDFNQSTTTLCAELDGEQPSPEILQGPPPSYVIQEDGAGVDKRQIPTGRRRRNGGMR